MKRMIIMEDNNAYKLSGKTGLSVSNDIYNGWFVGYIQTHGKSYFFASNIAFLIEKSHFLVRTCFFQARNFSFGFKHCLSDVKKCLSGGEIIFSGPDFSVEVSYS